MANQRGLTLVELLIVVAITMILSAIATVVTFRAVHRSRVSACAANLSNIGKAIMLYSADNNDEIPAIVTKQVTLPSGGVVPEGVGALISAYSAYGAKPEIWKCPLDRFPVPYYLPRPFTASPELSSYETSLGAWNLFDPATGRLDLGRASDLSKLPYLRDVTIEYADREERTSHGNTRNTLFLDGHVKQVPTPVYVTAD